MGMPGAGARAGAEAGAGAESRAGGAGARSGWVGLMTSCFMLPKIGGWPCPMMEKCHHLAA